MEETAFDIGLWRLRTALQAGLLQSPDEVEIVLRQTLSRADLSCQAKQVVTRLLSSLGETAPGTPGTWFGDLAERFLQPGVTSPRRCSP